MPVTFYGNPRFDTKETAMRWQGDVKAIAELEDRFAVAYQAGSRTSLFCSADGVTQLFYAVQGGALHYGSSVSDVIGSAGLNWQWNYEALADLATFGHVIGDHTLHAAVRRVGSAELVTWDGLALSRKKLDIQRYSTGDPSKEAIEVLLETVRAEAGTDDLISLSAGFDSRMILAAFLALGMRPNLLVMGADRSTDATIATEIARKFNLPLEHVPLDGNRMITDRSLIVRLTSGTKTIDNWHTYEYIAAGNGPAPGTGIWIGSNGEFARTFFFDRGLQFYVANALGSPLVRKFWDAKVRRNALPDSLRPFLVEELRECLKPEKQIARLLQFFPQRSLGDTNDQLYLERVRQFVANGLRLVSTRYPPRTPFLHPKWIAAVKRMPRHLKLGNHWHRLAISHLCPELLRFPYDTSGKPMSQGPGFRYWLGFSPHSRNIPYFDYVNFFNSPRFREVYKMAIPALNGIFLGDDTSMLLGKMPFRTTAYFATLSFFAEMQVDSSSPGRA